MFSWFSELLDLEIKLRHAIEDYLGRQERDSAVGEEEIVERLRRRDEILYGGSGDDPFGVSVDAKIEDLKGRVVSYLS